MYYKQMYDGQIAVKAATCELVNGEPVLYVYKDSEALLSNLF